MRLCGSATRSRSCATARSSGQEIVLAPADDYITAFVKEVNRGRVIQAGTVMRPLDGPADGMRVANTTTLESAAKDMCDAGQSRAVVVDAEGAPVGVLDLHAIVSAMVTPAKTEVPKLAAE